MTENTGQEPTTDKSDPLTIKEIARLTGVSIGTVDRVLHDRGRVSADTKARIQALVAQRGYTPNIFASRLSGGAAAKTIGVLMPEDGQDYGYWRLISNGIQKAAKELGPLGVTLRVEPFNRQSSEDCSRAFRALADTDGLALAPIHARVLRPLVEALAPGNPLVFFDTDMSCDRDHCFIGQDPWQGGALAAKLLGMASGPEKSLMMVRFDEDDEHLLARCTSFEETALGDGRKVLVLEHQLGTPLDLRLQQTARFLADHPEAGGIFVPNASVGEYTQVAGTLSIAGYDLIPVNQKALQENKLDFILSQRPEIMGYESIIRLGRNLLFQEPIPKRINIPLDVVFKENLSGHLEQNNDLVNPTADPAFIY